MTMKKNNNNKTFYKICTFAAVAAMSATVFTGCGKKKEEVATTTEAAAEPTINVSPVAAMESPSDVNVIYKEGMVLSELSGEWIDESLRTQKPLCIMINNIIDAMPQSGISKADITYEFLVESGITRLMCVFKDYATGIGKLGPVRSSRHYYAQVAEQLEGIYAHFGWSAVAEEYIKSRPGYENLNGLELEGSVYYRDNSRVAPHNVYTDSEKIMLGIEKKGYNLNHSDSFHYNNFKFNTKDTALGTGNVANKVTTVFHSARKPWFEYNSEDGRYYRYQYDTAHIDAETGEQLSYKNIIVMYAAYQNVGDTILLDVIWNEGGSGYYITDGEYEPITWSWTGEGIQYKTADGKTLKMNPGNTYISVLNSRDSQCETIFE